MNFLVMSWVIINNMKILTNKEYLELIKLVREFNWTRTYKELYEESKVELKEAKDLKVILEKLYPLNDFKNSLRYSDGGSIDWGQELPDNVLVYVDDILGGKVIKQEGTKCIVISKDGKITEGITKQKSDKGYSYKLVRE